MKQIKSATNNLFFSWMVQLDLNRVYPLIWYHMKAGDYSDFEYAELSHDPELKAGILHEVRSQLVKILYSFADRKLGIKNEEDLKDHIYERQQVTTRFFMILSQLDAQYQDLDDLYLGDPQKLLTFLKIKTTQLGNDMEQREGLDLKPDAPFKEELSEFCKSIKDRVKYIQYRNLAMKLLKDLQLDLFTINLISQYMFNQQDAAYDIRELAIYYKQDYGFQIAKLISEIILRFIQLHKIQSDKSILISDRVQLERELTEEIDERIFVHREEEKQEVYNRIKRIIQFGYTLTELNQKIRDVQNPDDYRIQILQLLGNSEYSTLIDGYLFEDMFYQGFMGNKGLVMKLRLIEKILKEYEAGMIEDRIMSIAMLHLHNTEPDNKRISFYRILAALVDKQPEMVKTYTAYLLSLRNILNNIWKEPGFTPPLPLVLHIWKTFDVMLRHFMRSFQEQGDVSELCEQSFNRVFIYNITRRPAKVTASEARKKDFEKVISKKYDLGDILIPFPNVAEVCPDLLESHFMPVDDLFVKLKPGISARSDVRIKALILHSREDLTLWLQRTRMSKLQSNLMMKESFSSELEELTAQIPIDNSRIQKRIK